MFGHGHRLAGIMLRGFAALSLAAGTMTVAVPTAAVHADPGDTCIITPVDGNGFSAELCGFIQAVPVGGEEEVTFGCTATVLVGIVGSTGVGCALLDANSTLVACACNPTLPGDASVALGGPLSLPVQTYHLCTAWYYQVPLLGGPPVGHPCINQTPL